MTTKSLKQAEIFVMLAIIFLLGVVFIEAKRKTEEDKAKQIEKQLKIILEQLDQKKEELTEKERELDDKNLKIVVIEEQLDEKEQKLNDKSEEITLIVKQLEEKEQELENRNQKITIIIGQLEEKEQELGDKEEELVNIQRQLTQAEEDLLETGSPIVILSEENLDYRFDEGSAVVPENLERALKGQIIDLLEQRNQHGSFNAIEIIGHTDEQRIWNTRTNLDAELIEKFQSGEVYNLRAGSNMDLGMMRAIAVTRILQQSKKEGRLKNIDYFFPSSAGQMILNDHTIATVHTGNDEPSRRRVEIRMLKYNPEIIEDEF